MIEIWKSKRPRVRTSGTRILQLVKSRRKFHRIRIPMVQTRIQKVSLEQH